MLTIRPRESRGAFNHGWLDTRHTFSFGAFDDPAFRGFRALRVINEDILAPGRGFAEHGHRDMEIISYVLSGVLRHTDSTGAREDITPGSVQRMSAGSGVRHAEANPSSDDPVHFLQIWIEPAQTGASPRHDTRAFPVHDRPGRFHLIASPDGADGSMVINQDARMFACLFHDGQSAELVLDPDRHAWIQIARGEATVNGRLVRQGDGIALSEEDVLAVQTDTGAEILLFDLA